MDGLVTLQTIGINLAFDLVRSAVKKAEEMSVSGFVVVYSRTGMLESAEAVGSGTPKNVAVAMDKIKTVLNNRRSTRIQREEMSAKGQDREDLADQIGSLLGGGVAIFANSERTEFVGAIAFSGGTEQEDEDICKEAVRAVGLYTDV